MPTPLTRAGAATFTTGGGSLTLAVTKPTGTQAGDLILIWCAAVGYGTLSWTCPGFTAVTVFNTGGTTSQQLLYRTADGTEGASFTVTSAISHPWDAGCISLGSVDPALFDPVPTVSGQATAASVTINVAGVTTTKDGDLLVWFGCAGATAAGTTPAAITVPAGFTAPSGVVQANSTGTGTALNAGLLFATNTQATHGATGAANGTAAAAVNNGGLLVAVPGAAAGVGTFGLAGAFIDPAVYSLGNSAANQATAVTDFTQITGRAPGVRRTAYGFRIIPASYSTDNPAVTGVAPLFGDNVPTNCYGTGTVASAISTWESVTRLTMGVRRKYYPGLPPTAIPSELQADKDAGREVALSFKPPYTSLSASALNTIDQFLSSCKTAGLVARITMYHEPVNENLSATQYGNVQAYYGATVRKYYPLNYSGQCTAGTTSAGTLANWKAYYNAAVNSTAGPAGAGATFDTASLDFYCSGYNGGARMDSFSAFTDGFNLPFGVLEWGVSEDSQTQAEATAYYNYLTTFFTARHTAGLGCQHVTHFSIAVSDHIGGWPPLTATDYQCTGSPSLIQKLATAVTG